MSRLLVVLAVALALSPATTLARQPGDDTLKTIDALLTAGKYADAEKAARARLATLERDGPSESIEVAHVLTRLGDALLRQGRSGEETQRIVERAAAIETRLEPGSRALGAALRNLASLFEARGDFARARGEYERAVETLRAAAGPDDRETLLMQKDLAMAWKDLGEYDRARTLLESALAVRTTQDPAHVDVAVLRHNLGSVYWQLGEYTAARESFLAAAEGLASALGADHPHVAAALEGLAVIQTNLGDYTAAHTTYRRVLAMRERVLPPGHPLIGQTQINLGDVLMALGDNAAARKALDQGLAIWQKSLGPGHPQLLIALTNLAVLHDRTGDRAGARRLMRRGIAIRERANGPDDPELIVPLTQLANLLADDGQVAAARVTYEKARRLGERTRGAGHPYIAAAHYEEGLRLAARGQVADAAPLLERAHAARLQALGPDHPDTGAALDAVARLAAHDGAAARAIEQALAAETLARRHFQAAASVLPERQALLYAEGRARSQDLAIFVAAREKGIDPTTVAAVWDAVIRSRALVLEEMSGRRRALAAAADAETRRIVDAATEARARLAQLFVRGPSSEEKPGEYARELAAALEESEYAEERLAVVSTRYRRDRAGRGVDLAGVRRALPEGAALVSFVRYETGAFNPPAARTRPAAYAAFVLPANSGTPALVPLGDARSFDALVARWREAVAAEATAPPMGAARREAAYRKAAAALRARAWDPVAAELGGAARVVIVPDGAMHLVDFATLPAGGDRYLVERGPTIHYVTAERDLSPADVPAGEGLLALGEPAFNRRPQPAPGAGVALRSECVTTPGRRFAPLPQSGREVERVAQLWRMASGRADVLRGTAASEAMLKARAPGHRVLHFATHAFVTGACAPAAGTAAVLESNPLLGAGLVLAGASRRGSDDNDGILTAEEASSMDLTGVEWAVLSSCESGGGVLRAGEGIFGLRRAFQVAGVRTVITSLWPVEDTLARTWMERLYSSRLERGRSTADAVRDANQALLADRRRSGKSAHPIYWGGFVAAGDWR